MPRPSETVCLVLASIPKSKHRFGLAEVVGTELEDRFGAGLRPELLAPFDPPVDLLDRRLHRAGHDRQAPAAVLVISHLRGPVAQIPQGLKDQPPWIALAALIRWGAEFGRAGSQLRQDRLHLARPDGLDPAHVN